MRKAMTSVFFTLFFLVAGIFTIYCIPSARETVFGELLGGNRTTQEENVKLKQSNTQLEQVLSECKDTLSLLEADKINLQTKLTNIESELDSVKTKLSLSKESNSELEKKVQRLTAERDSLDFKYTTALDKIDELNVQIEYLEANANNIDIFNYGNSYPVVISNFSGLEGIFVDGISVYFMFSKESTFDCYDYRLDANGIYYMKNNSNVLNNHWVKLSDKYIVSRDEENRLCINFITHDNYTLSVQYSLCSDYYVLEEYDYLTICRNWVADPSSVGVNLVNLYSSTGYMPEFALEVDTSVSSTGIVKIIKTGLCEPTVFTYSENLNGYWDYLLGIPFDLLYCEDTGAYLLVMHRDETNGTTTFSVITSYNMRFLSGSEVTDIYTSHTDTTLDTDPD